jgi:glycosyltransferase involved in cell wall biosynthesis
MTIAVDLRSLQTKGISGVENYILNLLEHMLTIDKDNRYLFFYNALKPQSLEHLQYVNAENVTTRIPNKLLNASLRLSGRPVFEQLIGDFDVLFLPNVNHYAHLPLKKSVITVHDLSPFIAPDFHTAKHRLWHWFLATKKVYAKADLLLAVSENTKQDLINHFGISERKIKVIYPGVNHAIFNPSISVDSVREVRNIYGLPGEYILFVSTLEPRKNVQGLIKAFEQLDSLDTSLVLVGKLGWKYAEILEAINSSKKKRLIKYLGYVDEAHKPAIMKLARTVAYPSFYEGFGFVPLEAMALGVPVVTSQVSSIPEVVRDAALLVDPRSIEDMAFALSEAVHNQVLRQQLIVKGQARAYAFTWEKTAQATLDVLNSVK